MLGITSKAISGKLLSHAPQIASLTSTQSKYLSTTQPARGVTLLQDKQNGFGFARSNPRPAKPRSKGVTEIRGPYYSVECIHQLCLYYADFGIGDGEALSGRRIRNVNTILSPVLIGFCHTNPSNSMGNHVDGLKFAGG